VALDRRLFFLFDRAHRALLAHANARALDSLGISSAQLAILFYVSKHEGCSLTAIANLLDLSKSAVTALVSRMERSGLLRREPNPNDGRGSHLFVTAKGKDIHTQALPMMRRFNAELMEGFSASEMDAIFRFLGSIVVRYGEEEGHE
jgi:DNA-binding MarR family transcriptional regulator